MLKKTKTNMKSMKVLEEEESFHRAIRSNSSRLLINRALTGGIHTLVTVLLGKLRGSRIKTWFSI